MWPRPLAMLGLVIVAGAGVSCDVILGIPGDVKPLPAGSDRTVRDGRLRTLAGTPVGAGAAQLRGQSLELSRRVCALAGATSLCVTGGLTTKGATLQ